MSAITANGIASIESGDAVAAKLLLDNVRMRLECLCGDVVRLYAALGGPPGSIRALGAELLDPDLDPPTGSRRAELRPLTAADRELLGL
jgi:hypothetical protein